MATPSEVKAGLDDAARIIRTERQELARAKNRIATAEANLADVIQTINNYGNTDPFEQLAKAEFALRAAEFEALKTQAGVAKSRLSDIDAF